MIGIDPHKASHTAVAIDQAEVPLGELRVRASAGQAGRLVEWAAGWPERTWAVEGAGGLGYLLAQQLVAAGERVLDVQPKLGARVRLLASGATGKTDPNDARSVAIAALRSAAVRPVEAEDHPVVLKVWSKRHKDLGQARSRVAGRLHAVLCELVPGGAARDITAARARRLVAAVTAQDAAVRARCELAGELIEDMTRLDQQLREVRKRLTAAVAASRTSVTEVFGVGPVVAGIIVGDVRVATRFASGDHFAAWNGTAPVEASSGPRKVHRLSLRGNRRVNHALHIAAVTQVRHRHSAGRAYYDKKLAEGKTPKEALRALKRQVSDAVFACLQADARQAAAAGPGGQPGNDSSSSAAGSHPARQLFGQATPEPAPTLRPPRRGSQARPGSAPRKTRRRT